MAEYIERSVAKEELLSWARCIKHPEHLMTEDAMYVLDSTPTADVVEVKHGRWIPTPEYDSCWCSCCKKQYTGFFASGWNYCPNCGARMDGAADKNVGHTIPVNDLYDEDGSEVMTDG